MLRGGGILWQRSKRDDLFCPSSTVSWRLLKPIKTSVWSYGEIHSLERTEVLPWGARSGDGSDFISRAVIWAKRVSAKLAGALVAIEALLFCNQSHCRLFDFWGWARTSYSESQSCLNSRYQRDFWRWSHSQILPSSTCVSPFLGLLWCSAPQGLISKVQHQMYSTSRVPVVPS